MTDFGWNPGYPLSAGGGGGGGGSFTIKGTIDCSLDPNYPPATQWDTYVVSVAGKIGGAAGKPVEAGDWVVALATNPGGNEAAVGTQWTVIQVNVYQATEVSMGIAELATNAEALAGSDDERIVTPAKLKNSFDSAITKVVFVDGNRVDAYGESGSWLHPYKTVQAAYNAVGDGTKIVIKPKTTVYNENLVIADKQNILFEGHETKTGDVVRIKSITINQTTTTKVYFKDIKIETGDVAVTALTYNDGTDCLFENVVFRNNVGGGGLVPVIDLKGTTAYPPWFNNCTIFNDGIGVVTRGTDSNGWIKFINCLDGADLDIVGLYNVIIDKSTGWKTITHQAAKLYFVTSQADDIVSTAPNIPANYLYCDNFSLRRSNMTQGGINKAGACNYLLGFGDYDSTAAVVAGARQGYTRNFVDLFIPGSKVLWVDKNRTDSYVEDGSIGRPYRTLTAANAVAAVGDSIFLYSGTFNENMTLVPGVCYVSYDKEKTLITSNQDTLVIPAAADVTLRNLNVVSTGVGKAAIKADTVAGDYITCENVRAEGLNSGYSFYFKDVNAVVDFRGVEGREGQSYFENLLSFETENFTSVTISNIIPLHIKDCSAPPSLDFGVRLINSGFVNFDGVGGNFAARIENSDAMINSCLFKSVLDDALVIDTNSYVELSSSKSESNNVAKDDINLDSTSTLVLGGVDFTKWTFAVGCTVRFTVDPPTIKHAGNPNAAPAVKGLFSQECLDTVATIWYKCTGDPDGIIWVVI